MLTINGRYLAARPTGVQRVAASLIRELDRQVEPEEARSWRLVRPRRSRAAGLEKIGEEIGGGGAGQRWEQIGLPRIAGKSVLLNLCNTAPLMHRKNVVMIHDAQVFLSPGSYGRAFRTWYRWLLPRLGEGALQILTVSEFSRRELARFGVADAARIEVIHNGCDHLAACPQDTSPLDRLGLRDRPFVVMMSSLQAHKNVEVVLRAFERRELAGVRLVLIGGEGAEAYEAAGLPRPEAVVFAGSLPDPALCGLLSAATALACPSRTEGFGLPPLEAMSLGCPAVVAPEGALPEVCGVAAVYADASDPKAWAEALVELTSPAVRDSRRALGLRQSERFTWAESGRRLLHVTRSLMDHPDVRPPSKVGAEADHSSARFTSSSSGSG